MLRTEKLPVFQVQIPHPLPSEFLDCSSKAPSPSRHPGLGVASKNHFSPERHASPQTRAPGQNVSQADLRAPRAPAMHPSAQKPEKKKTNPQAPFSAVKPDIHSPMYLPGSMVSLYWASAELGATAMGSEAAGTLSRSLRCRCFPVAK